MQADRQRKIYAPWFFKLNSVALVRERTMPTERPPLVGEVVPTFADTVCYLLLLNEGWYLPQVCPLQAVGEVYASIGPSVWGTLHSVPGDELQYGSSCGC
jgi:hypothetical protein